MSGATGPIQTTSCTHQNNRFWYMNTTWNWIAYGDIGRVPAPTLLSNPYTTPCGTQRHLDIQSTDIYWFAGGVGVGAYSGAGVYGFSSMTTDQNNRASHYGDMVDKIRAYQAGHYPAPLFQFVENGGPYTEDATGASYMQPQELNGAAWSTIIHGGRGLIYFNHSFGGPAQSNDNLAQTYYRTIQPGQATSIYAQTKATNALIKSLATVINSPFADGYVTVSPAPSTPSDFTGFDVMAKRHSSGQFYIFAMPRWSKTLSNQSATFTIKNTGATQVTVVNESRSLPVTNGGTQFVDNFATANTVHIYQVDLGTPPAPQPPGPATGVRVITGSTGGNGTSSCPSGQLGTYPDCVPMPPAPVASGKQWALVYSEEFNGTALDPTRLTPCFDWNYGDCTATFNQGKERYLPSQVRVNGGTAKLVAEPLSPPYANSACYQGQCTYKAGLVSTARPNAGNGSGYLFPFTYGYVESRMKFPATAGFFTAFWMLPTNPSYSYNTEIDIAEILGGHADTSFMNYHYSGRSTSYTPNSGLHNNGACPVKDYSTDFVRFGLDWQPTYIAWYIDGVKCGQFTGNSTTIENGPMQLILHMMIDNSWERDWGSVLSSQTLVGQLEVDYIRIYQQK